MTRFQTIFDIENCMLLCYHLSKVTPSSYFYYCQPKRKLKCVQKANLPLSYFSKYFLKQQFVKILMVHNQVVIFDERCFLEILNIFIKLNLLQV